MTIGLPGWLKWLGDKMGEKFPEGDEDAIGRLADDYRAIADGLESTALNTTRSAISTALGNINGRTRDALDAEYASLTSGDASIDTLVSQVRALADALDKMRTEVQFTKEMYIANLLVLAASIAALIATAWLNWSAPAEVAVAIAATRAIVTRMVMSTVGRILSEQAARVVAEIAFKMLTATILNTSVSLGMDLSVQEIQMLQGTRHEIDRDQAGADAAAAAITGLISGGLGLGLSRIMPDVNNVTRDYVQGVATNTVGMVGAQEVLSGDVDLGSALQAGLVFGGVDALHGTLHRGDETGHAGATSDLDVDVEVPPSVSSSAEVTGLHGNDTVGRSPSDGNGAGAGSAADVGGGVAGHSTTTPSNSVGEGVSAAPGTGAYSSASAAQSSTDTAAGVRGAETAGSHSTSPTPAASTSTGASNTASAGDARGAGPSTPRVDGVSRPAASLSIPGDGPRLSTGSVTPATHVAESPASPIARQDSAPAAGSTAAASTSAGSTEQTVAPRHGYDVHSAAAERSGEGVPSAQRPHGLDGQSRAAEDVVRSGSRDGSEPSSAASSATRGGDVAGREAAPHGRAEPTNAGRGAESTPASTSRPVHDSGAGTAGGESHVVGNRDGQSSVSDSEYVPESGDETCAADVIDYLSESTGNGFVLETEPSALGVPARDLFEAIGSDALPDTYSGIHDSLLVLGDGAQALIASRWTGEADGLGGHTYIAVNDNGTIHLVDPLTGARSGWPPHWGEENVGSVVSGYFHPDGSVVHPLSGSHGLIFADEIGEVGAGPRLRWSDPGRGEPTVVTTRPDLGVGADGTPVVERKFAPWTAEITPKLDPHNLGTSHPEFRVVARAESELDFPVGAHPDYPEYRVIETSTTVGGNEMKFVQAYADNKLLVPVGGELKIGEVIDRVDRPASESRAQKVAASGYDGTQEVHPTDHGGHMFGFRFVMAQGLKNLFAQDGYFNTVSYRVMENEWADFARYGARLEVEIRLAAEVVGERPNEVQVEGEAYSARSNLLLEDVDLFNDFMNDSSQTYRRRYYKADILRMVAEVERSAS